MKAGAILHAAGARFHECAMPSKAPWYCSTCRSLVHARTKARRAVLAADKSKDTAAIAAAKAELAEAEAPLDALAEAGGCGCWWGPTEKGNGYATTGGRTPEQLRAGLRAGRVLGLRPASLGLLVVDVDWPTKDRAPDMEDAWHAALDRMIEAVAPDAWYTSISGWGAHLLVRLAPSEAARVRNRKWTCPPNGPGGEIRCATGYAVTPVAGFPALVTAYEASPRPLADLPAFLKLGPAPAKSTVKSKAKAKATAKQPATAGELADALRHVAGVDDYDEWVAVGAALHGWHATAGLALWKDWSRTGAKHADGDCELKWSTFGGSPSKAGSGSIFYRAKEGGWKPDPFNPGGRPPRALAVLAPTSAKADPVSLSSPPEVSAAPDAAPPPVLEAPVEPVEAVEPVAVEDVEPVEPVLKPKALDWADLRYRESLRRLDAATADAADKLAYLVAALASRRQREPALTDAVIDDAYGPAVLLGVHRAEAKAEPAYKAVADADGWYRLEEAEADDAGPEAVAEAEATPSSVGGGSNVTAAAGEAVAE